MIMTALSRVERGSIFLESWHEYHRDSPILFSDSALRFRFSTVIRGSSISIKFQVVDLPARYCEH